MEATKLTRTICSQEIQFMHDQETGEFWAPAEEIGLALGYQNPRRSIWKLYKANEDELQLYKSVTETMTDAGSKQQTLHFNEEGIYIIAMLARTPQAKVFRCEVAKVLKALRQQAWKEAIERADMAQEYLRDVLDEDPYCQRVYRTYFTLQAAYDYRPIKVEVLKTKTKFLLEEPMRRKNGRIYIPFAEL